MKIIGTLSTVMNTLLINPYEGNSTIVVERLFDDARQMAYYKVKCDDVEHEYETVRVIQSGQYVPHCAWSTSVNNPYVLLEYVLKDAIEDVKKIASVTSKFLCDIPINSHFAILYEEHMLKVLVRNVSAEFPSTWNFDATTSRIRVNANWLQV